jgi:hypothetical protein
MRENPMPISGALVLRNNGKRRRRASIQSVIARLRNGSKRRRSTKARRHNLKPWRPTVRANRKRSHSKRRRNGLLIRTNGLMVMKKKNGRKRSHRKGRRHNGSYMVRRNGKRRNGLLIRTNGIPGLGMVTSLVKKVPFFGGIIAPAIVPAAVGAIAIVGTHFLLKYAVPMLQDVPYVGVALDYIRPVGYTVGGLAFGTAIVKLPIPFISVQTRKMIAAAAIVGGAAVDALTALSEREDAVAGLMFGPGRSSLGDGGLWQSVPYGGQPRHFSYGDASSEEAVMADYVDASPADAAVSADDLSQEEGQAALLGARAWRARFPQIVRPVRSTADRHSRHAAKEGHQWGWLCRLVGWKNFEQIVRMSKGRRRAYIAKLRAAAIAMIPEAVQAQRSQRSASYAGLLIAQ